MLIKQRNFFAALLPALALIFGASAQSATSTPGSLAVVSAASYTTPVAPGSIASAFGTGMAAAPAWATLDSSGKLPTTLGGVSMTVGGVAAPLIYVSPNQVNFVIPDTAPTGSQPVTLTGNGGATFQTTVPVQTVAPGIFTVTCCRPYRGAIENGVTFGIEPFSVTTTANGGSDKHTRITIFGTGIKNAKQTTVSGVLSTGATVPLTVEFSGAAPGFVGLDQVNAVIPAEFQNVGLTQILLTSDKVAANTVDTQFDEPAPDTANVPAYLISTALGAGSAGSTKTTLNAPWSVALDSSHNLYIADAGNHVVRQVTPAGAVTIFAGTGTAGNTGDGGPANKATLQSPVALAVDRQNNVYIVDSTSNRVRMVDASGTIHAFAGNGTAGFSGDGGDATKAELNGPAGIADFPNGTIAISDTGNNRIRIVAGDGMIGTLAGTGEAGFSGDGGPAATAQLNAPGSIAISNNIVYVADSKSSRIRQIDDSLNIRTIAGTGQAGNVGDGSGPLAAEFQGPLSITIDRLNRLWIADAGSHRVRMISLDCLIHPLAGTGSSGTAGDGSPAASAQFEAPAGIVTDVFGNAWIADSSANNVRLLNFSNGKTNCSALPQLAFEPSVVIGGASLTGYIQLACPATSAETITLSSNVPGVTIPASVTIAPGQTIAAFPITTPNSTTTEVVTITATGPQGTSTGTFVITPTTQPGSETLSLKLSSNTVTGGQNLIGFLTTSAIAPTGGTPVSLSVGEGSGGGSSDTVRALQSGAQASSGGGVGGITIAAGVTVPTGQNTATFLIQTSPVTSPISATVTAKTTFATAAEGFSVMPPSGTIASVVISPNPVVGGSAATGTITLGTPAPGGGIPVTISGTGCTVNPTSLTIPAGQTTATFQVGTKPVTVPATCTVTVTATNTVTTNLTINPPPANTQGQISALTLNPTTVAGGATSQGTVTLATAAGVNGVLVFLSATNPASVPASINIPPGATSGTFTVSTSTVTAQQTATVTATSANSVNATLTVTVTKAKQGQITGLTLNPTTVTGGSSSTGTVTLQTAAGTDGVLVTLSSNNAAATVPTSIVIPSGATTGTFQVSTTSVTATAAVVITAASTNTVTANLTVNPGNSGGQGQISGVTLNPASVNGGSPSTGTVTLQSAAGSSGVKVTLASNNAAATVPASITIPAGQTSGTFTVTTNSVTSTQTVTITATSANSSSASLTINPGTAGTAQIASFSLNPTSVTGGGTSTGTVTLAAAAPSNGALVNLASNNAAATVPASITIPSGQTSGTFTVSTNTVTSTQTANITATSANSVSAPLTINAGSPGKGQIASVSLNPATVTGGSPSTGTVMLSAAAPSNGILVTLASNNAAATVPTSIIITSGQTSGTFTVTTTSVTSTQTASITATSANSSSANLTVNATSVCISALTLNVSITNLLSGQGLLSGTITLTGPAPAAGETITLASAGLNLGTITVPGGQSSATINLSLSNIVSTVVALLTNGVNATLNGCPLLNVHVSPNGPLPGTISGISLNPTSVTGGGTSTGTVTLSSAAGSSGVLVLLSSGNSAATVPASITIPSGQTSGTFTVSTTSVTSTQSASITATSANTMSATLTINPGNPGTGQISSISLNPTTVSGGSPSTGTVTLASAAGAAGVKVTLASNNAAATVPASIIIASGQTAGTFQAITTSVTSTQTASITATSANSSSANLTINPAQVCISTLTLNISITSLLSGQGLLSGTVTLNGPAPAGGQQIQLVGAGVNLGNILVPEGQTTAPISLSINNLVTILSSILSSGVNAVTNGCPLLNVKVNPNGPLPGTISAITLNPTSVTGGATSTGTVTLGSPAGTTGVLVSLSSGNSAATVPVSITIPAGQTSGTFTVSTTSVPTTQTAAITATSANTMSANLTINTGNPGTGQISSVTLNPTTVSGGSPSTGTVTLASAAGAAGVKVTLASSNAAATVPASIIIPSGQTTGTFQATTTSVTSTQTASITATSANSSSANLTINPAQVCISTLTLNISITSLLSGQGLLSGTVTLNGPAPAGGQQIQLVGAGVNLGNILVPEGQTTAPISLSINNLVTILSSILSSGVNAVTNGCPLLNIKVNPNGPLSGTIAGITVNPTSVNGGGTSTGTVTLSAPAGSTGVQVLLSSDNAAATLPASLTIPSGQTSGTFTINTNTVTSTQTANIRATSANSMSTPLTINTGNPGQGQIASVILNPTTVAGTGTSTGTVTLSSPAPSNGVLVNLSSNNAAASVPASITIAAGQTSGTFSVTTTSVASTQTATITATSANSSTAALTINPGTPGQGQIGGVVLNPATVTAGGTSTGTVTLSAAAPANGVAITLTSSNPAVASTVASITIPSGQTTGTFPVTTTSVTSQQSVTFTAASANSMTATLTVNPAVQCVAGLTLSVSITNLLSGQGLLAGTVSLTGPAPAGGEKINLISTNPSIGTLGSILVPAGATSAPIQIPITVANLLTIVGSTVQGVLDILNPCSPVTVTVTLNGPGAETVSSVTLNPTTVTGGNTSTGTVTIGKPAGSGGIQVSLASSDPSATVPSSITITSGSTTGTFTVTTTAVTTQQTVTITATSKSAQQATLTLNPSGAALVTLSSLSLNPTAVTGGNASFSTSTGTVTLAAAAPSNGAIVNLTSSNAAASLPASITIPSGQTSGTFTITASSVPSLTTASITASSTNTLPPAGLQIYAVSCIQSLNVTLLSGGTLLGGTVTLTSPAGPGGETVALLAVGSNTQIGNVVIPQGATQAAINLSATLGAVLGVVGQVLGSSCGPVQVGITILGAPALAVSVNPSTITGAGTVTGTVTLGTTAPAPTVVNLASSDSNSASAPPSVTIPANTASANFTITAVNIAATKQVVFTATTAGGLNAQGSLTVNPPPPQPATISSLTLNPAKIGLVLGASTGTVTLSAPAGIGGVKVTLSVDGALVSLSTPSIVIPSGQTSGTFGITTLLNLLSGGTVHVTATSSNSVEADLTVGGLL